MAEWAGELLARHGLQSGLLERMEGWSDEIWASDNHVARLSSGRFEQSLTYDTGHPGGLATIHANSAAEALTRLEGLIGEVTQRVPFRAIAQAINVVVFIERTATGRRIRDVSRLVGREGDAYLLKPVLASGR